MLIVRRSATKAGAWLLKRATALTKSLMNRARIERDESGGAARKRKFIDGFLLEGKRVGPRGVATVLDLPAYIVCSGDSYYQSRVMSGQMISLMAGRDNLLAADEDRKVSEFALPFSFAAFYSGLNAGDPPLGEHRYRLAVTGGYPLIEAGCTGVDVQINMQGIVPNWPMAYAKPGDDLSAYITVYAPTFYHAKADMVEGAWVPEFKPLAPTAVQSGWSVKVNEALIRLSGADGMICKRASAPVYGASLSGDDIAFSGAQSPWLRSRPIQVAEIEGGGLAYAFAVVAHAVVDQKSGDDVYAARCLWITRLLLVAGEVIQGLSYLRDRRGLGITRGPNLNDDGSAYTFNSHPYAEIALLDNGTILVLDFFTTTATAAMTGDPGENFYQYRTVELLRFRPDASVPEVVVLQDALRTDGLLNAADMFFPVGGDSDGETAIFVVFSSNMLSVAAMPIYIIAVTNSTSSVVLAQDVLWRPVGGDIEANGVTYIGNGKFAFTVSSRLDWNGTTPGQQRGDWACVIYDLSTNTLTLAGIIEPETQLYGRSVERTKGRMDCPAYEAAGDAGEVIRLATLIASRGGETYGNYMSGGGNGATYASYDSGITWQKIAEYGSSQGAFYCGNAAQQRKYNGKLTAV